MYHSLITLMFLLDGCNEYCYGVVEIRLHAENQLSTLEVVEKFLWLGSVGWNKWLVKKKLQFFWQKFGPKSFIRWIQLHEEKFDTSNFLLGQSVFPSNSNKLMWSSLTNVRLQIELLKGLFPTIPAKPHIRMAKPHISMAKPHIRPAKPHIRPAKPHIRGIETKAKT